MHDAARGELNSPDGISFERSRVIRCQNPARVASSVFRFSGDRMGRGSKQSETPGRRRPVARSAGQARGRKHGRNPVRRFVPRNPKRAKPKGAASGRRTNPAAGARDSRKGESPEAAARWAGPAQQRGSNQREKRQVGSSPRKRGGYLPRGESSAGRNPRSAAGTKQDRHGRGGRKPPRG